MKVAVIGANGQLGQDVVRAFADRGDDVQALNHEDVELSSLDSVVACLRSAQPEVVVNTAAMHHVENCEQQPARRRTQVNVIGARNLACGNPRSRIGIDPRQHRLCIRRQERPRPTSKATRRVR